MLKKMNLMTRVTIMENPHFGFIIYLTFVKRMKKWSLL